MCGVLVCIRRRQSTFLDAGTPAGGFWSHKKALLAPARVFGSRAYLEGGRTKRLEKNPEKVEKVKKKLFFFQTCRISSRFRKNHFVRIFGPFWPTFGHFSGVLGPGVVGPI